MPAESGHGYERPPRLSPAWLLILLLPVAGIFAYGRIGEAVKARRAAKAASGEVDWDEVREDYRRQEQAVTRAREARMEDEAELRQRVLDAHKANVEACIERAAKFLPGPLPSPFAKAKIAADCAEAEAKIAQPGHPPASL